MLWLVTVVWAASPQVVLADAGAALYAAQGDVEPAYVTPTQIPLAVVSTAGDWIEGRTHIEPRPTCDRLADRNPALDLTLWVRRDDLARVVTRRVELTHADGSRLVFHAGYQAEVTPDWPTTAAWAAVESAWQANLPADAWGTFATPDTTSDRPDAWKTGVDLTQWDGAMTLLEVPYLLPDTRGLFRRGRPDALAPPEGGRLYTPFALGCLELTAVAPGIGPTVDRPSPERSLRAIRPSERTHAIAPGVALSWPNGQPAGTTRSETYWSPTTDDPDRACGPVALLGPTTTPAGPVLCAPSASVRPDAHGAPDGMTPTDSSPSGLSPELIDAVVKTRVRQLRHCYERKLKTVPDLAGSLVVSFTIGSTGSVTSAQSSTLGNADVEQCVVGRFLQLQFPPPADGGTVMVSYRFVFQPEAPAAP